MNRIRTAALATTALMAAAAFSTAPTAQAAGTWEFLDLIVDGRYDTAAIDDTGDGVYDRWFVDVDVNGNYDMVFYETNRDNALDWIYVGGIGQAWFHDSNADGYFDHLMADADGNGAYEAEYFDSNTDGFFEWHKLDVARYDGFADTWTLVSSTGSSSGSSSTGNAQAIEDIMTEHIVTMGMMDNLADALL